MGMAIKKHKSSPTVIHNRDKSEIKVETGKGNRDDSRNTKTPSLTPMPPGVKIARNPIFNEKAYAPVRVGYMLKCADVMDFTNVKNASPNKSQDTEYDRR